MVRFKNRWILVEFIPIATSTALSTSGHGHATTHSPQSPEVISGKDVFTALKQSILLHFGDVGWGEVGASLAVKYFSPATNLCILRVARGSATNTTWAALVLLNRVGPGAGNGEGRKVVPHVIHVSGTLKHAQIATVEWNRETIARAKAGVNVYGVAPQHENSNSFIAHLETSMQEIEKLQD